MWVRLAIATVAAAALAALLHAVDSVQTPALLALPLVPAFSVLLVYVLAAVVPSWRHELQRRQTYHVTALLRGAPHLAEAALICTSLCAISVGGGAVMLLHHWGGWQAMSWHQRAVIAMHAAFAPLMVFTVMTTGRARHEMFAITLLLAAALAFGAIELYLFRCNALSLSPTSVASLGCALATLVVGVMVMPTLFRIGSESEWGGTLSARVAALELLALSACGAAYSQLLWHEDSRRSDATQRYAVRRISGARARRRLRTLVLGVLARCRCFDRTLQAVL